LEATIHAIERLRENIPKARSIEELMGLEGNIRNTYYQAWDSIVGEDFLFEGRTKRPPQNPLNALISFCNSLLYTTVLGEIYHTNLHPAISYLHSPRERRFSLALDISEIFKPVLVDRLIWKLIHTKEIQKKHFRESLNFSYLEDDGRKIVLKAYDDRLRTTIKHRNLGRNVSYKHLIRLECYKLVNHLVAGEEYRGYRSYW
jgi:CRISPR-associated protein Cas1